MTAVLKKEKKEYQISINTADDKKDSTKREAPKLDQYISLIGQLIQVNSSLTNNTHVVNDNIDNFNDKRKAITKDKYFNNDQLETKFSITHLKDKSETLETHKKGFFLITDELNEEEDDMSLKIKREILVGKLMYDKNIIIDKEINSNFNDLALSSVFLTLSNESRKVLLEQYNENPHDYNMFHSIIGFKKEKSVKNYLTSNEAIMNMCEKLLKFEDLSKLEEINYEKSSSLIDRKSSFNAGYANFGIKQNQTMPRKFIVESSKSEEFNTNIQPVEIKRENQLEITTKPLVEEQDEEFDYDEYNYFVDFIKHNENNPIKEKIEKILILIQSQELDKIPLKNKTKNEILRNLKQEYLNKLGELNKIEEDKRLMKEKEQELIKKRNFRIENPFEDTLETPQNTSINKSRVGKKKNNSNIISNSNVVNSNQPSKNKVILTQKGWGVSDIPNSNKKQNNSSNLNIKKNEDLNVSNRKVNNFRKIINQSNQKVIKNKKVTNSNNSNNKEENDNVWIGTQMDSDSDEGEWVTKK